MEETLVKYKHCGQKIYVFSDRVRVCPICRHTVSFGLLDAPVVVPAPFTNGHRVACAFTIGSALGPAHLGEWSDSELHVGISNSAGLVFSYTLAGVRQDATGWERSVCIQLVPPCRPALEESWDAEIQRFSLRPEWSSERFEEQREFGSCCYGFALSFINHIRSLDNKAGLSRDEFTRRLVSPHMSSVSRYIQVHRAVSQQGFFIHPSEEQQELGIHPP
ncbi:hypothetical protein DNTS_023053 [Danionella cerebrum]|uniref:MKRN2 opposite strand protein-like C-terminal domain-containing protein n=1 Tax=Danionella cerebrum TaxID=2873325 RepID=A0A553Q5B2_9TELE|nr:hypothetical protein DNTS_023053 [Danionella translucida]